MPKSLCRLLIYVNHVLVANFSVINMSLSAIRENKIIAKKITDLRFWNVSFRSKHGVGKVKHGKDLSDYAQKWAEQLAARNGFEHSSCTLKGERLGENICCKWSSAGADYTGNY